MSNYSRPAGAGGGAAKKPRPGEEVCPFCGEVGTIDIDDAEAEAFCTECCYVVQRNMDESAQTRYYGNEGLADGGYGGGGGSYGGGDYNNTMHSGGGMMNAEELHTAATSTSVAGGGGGNSGNNNNYIYGLSKRLYDKIVVLLQQQLKRAGAEGGSVGGGVLQSAAELLAAYINSIKKRKGGGGGSGGAATNSTSQHNVISGGQVGEDAAIAAVVGIVCARRFAPVPMEELCYWMNYSHQLLLQQTQQQQQQNSGKGGGKKTATTTTPSSSSAAVNVNVAKAHLSPSDVLTKRSEIGRELQLQAELAALHAREAVDLAREYFSKRLKWPLVVRGVPISPAPAASAANTSSPSSLPSSPSPSSSSSYASVSVLVDIDEAVGVFANDMNRALTTADSSTSDDGATTGTGVAAFPLCACIAAALFLSKTSALFCKGISDAAAAQHLYSNSNSNTTSSCSSRYSFVVAPAPAEQKNVVFDAICSAINHSTITAVTTTTSSANISNNSSGGFLSKETVKAALRALQTNKPAYDRLMAAAVARMQPPAPAVSAATAAVPTTTATGVPNAGTKRSRSP